MDLTLASQGRPAAAQPARAATSGEAERRRSRSRSPVRERTGGATEVNWNATGAGGASSIPITNTSPEQAEVLNRELITAQERLNNLAATYANTNEPFMIFIQGGTDGRHQTLVLFADDRRTNRRPQTNNKNGKLIYYVEEPNMGRGFIKEPCFSNDGRIICSPFAHGFRLLSFDTDCNELEYRDDCMPPSGKASELKEVASVYSHQNLVVATKYSPTHQLLVTGCLDGQVGFHQPLL